MWQSLNQSARENFNSPALPPSRHPAGDKGFK